MDEGKSGYLTVPYPDQLVHESFFQDWPSLVFCKCLSLVLPFILKQRSLSNHAVDFQVSEIANQCMLNVFLVHNF